MARRRYDTEALVGDLKRERRHAVLLSFLGLSIIVFLVVYFARLRGPDVPEVPQPVTVNPGAPGGASSPATPAPAGTSTSAPASGEPSEKNARDEATLEIRLAKPGSLWLDGQLIGKKVQDHSAKLAPGKHKVQAKLGRKPSQLTFEIEAGKRYRLELDARKKKPAVEVIAD